MRYVHRHLPIADEPVTAVDELAPNLRQAIELACFEGLSESEMAERMGCKGAERIPEGRPGLAISDRHGPIQTYFVEQSALGQRQNLLPGLSELERTLFTRALAEGGKLPVSNIQEWGSVSEWQARRMVETWAIKGWLAKDSNRDNAFCITPKAQVLISNHHTPQTGSNRIKPSQTT